MKENAKHTLESEKKLLSSLAKPAGYKNSIAVLLISLYLIVDFIPLSGAVDVMGPQWLYLSLVNLLITAYIIIEYKKRIKEIILNYSGNIFVLCYSLFFILAGVSIFSAINPVESIVVYTRLTITIICFFNISILLKDHLKSIGILCQIISVCVLIQCIPILLSFISGMNNTLLSTLVLSMTGNAGNKNIVASSLIVKLPFIVFCLFRYSALWRNMINIVALFLAVLLIFLLIARTAYVSLAIQFFVYLIFFAKYHFDKTKLLKSILYGSRIVVPILIAFMSAQILLLNAGADIEKAEAAKNKSEYTSVISRASTITESGSLDPRLYFWKNAIRHIKDHPLTGTGYGNWKINSVYYEKDHHNDFDFSKQVHNDFLQIAAECGIPAALLFTSLFIIVLLYTFKIHWSNAPEEVKMAVFFSLISLGGYFTDAFFNFPADRPIMQVFFALAMAFIIAAFISIYKNHPANYHKTFFSIMCLVFVMLIIPCIYIAYSTYRSMRVQTLTHYDFGRRISNVTWQDVKNIPDIPNLTEINVPVNAIKAWYLSKDFKYEEALAVINETNNVNPHAMYNEWIKASIFYSTDRIDSAYYYAKKGFFNRPRNLQLFNIVTRAGITMNDPKTVKRAFQEFKRYRDEPHGWMIYIRTLFALNYNQAEVIAIADSVANVYKDDPEIRHTKYFVRAGAAAKSGNYSEALKDLNEILKINPQDYDALENTGLTYFFLHDYINAAAFFRKVIESKSFRNGKSEYYLGLSLIQLGEKEEACNYLSIAAFLKYPNSDSSLKNNKCN